MTKTSSLALLAAVWGAGLLAAAAAWKVHQPPVANVVIEPAPIGRAEVNSAVATPPEPTFIRMAPVTIVGRVPQLAPPPAKKVVHCSDWRTLAQGPADGQVRVCE